MDERTFNSLPLEQRKAAQQRLIDLGLYNARPDGKWGAGTKAAFEQEVKRAEADAKAAREAAQTDKKLEIELLKAQGDKTTSDTDAAAKLADSLRRRLYQEQESSPEGIATQIAATGVPPIAAGIAGMRTGDKVNQYLDSGQEKRNVKLRGAADDRIRGLTTRKGAIEGVERAGAMPSKYMAARVASRMAPHLGLGGLAIGKGATLLADVDEDQAFYPRMADRAQGLGWIGFGSGLAKKGVQYAAGPGVSPDSQALAVINSEGLRRNGLSDALRGLNPAAEAAPDAPEAAPKTAAPGSKAFMVDQAKELGIKGTSRMTKPQLADALARALSEHGTKRTRAPKIPGGGTTAALAGGLAYALTPDRADAATGEPTGNRAEALTNAGVAGGTAAGVGYGMDRLARALGPMGRPAAGGALSMMGPMSAGDMTDDFASAEARNSAARNLPEALRFGAVEDAYQMAQVPERAPDPLAMKLRGFGQNPQSPEEQLPDAAALQIPEGIPAPNPDGSSPYPQTAEAPEQAPEAPGSDFDRLVAASQDDPELAELLRQAILARIGGGEQMEQIPQAMASQAVAARGGDNMASALRNFAAR